MAKISFIGDIMCEPVVLKYSKLDNKYDFSEIFSEIKVLLEESDYVIGNLETPLAGEEAGYTKKLLSFNAPDSFVDSLVDMGIDMFIVANNHMLDRGIDGLKRTANILSKKNIPFSGISNDENSRPNIAYFTLEDKKYSVISYTYGTNYSANKVKLEGKQKNLINLLRPQEELYFVPKRRNIGFFEKVIRKLLSYINEEERFYILKSLGMKYNFAREDDNLNKETMKPYLENLQKDIQEAKRNSDTVIFFGHLGGQFNTNPGIFSEYVFNKVREYGADIILSSHTHVVQKFEKIDSVPCFYSLGNFNMSPSTVYLLFENLPHYGIIPNIYLNSKGIEKISFYIIKTVENKRSQMKVYNTFDLYNKLEDNVEKEELLKDIKFIYNKVCGRDEDFKLSKEYFLD